MSFTIIRFIETPNVLLRRVFTTQLVVRFRGRVSLIRGSIDMTAHNKIVVITGGNAGIGFATAMGLAKQGATIVIICRNADRGNVALKAISDVAVASPRLFIADLSSQASIRELAVSLHEQLPRIDVLINNVG